jgi:hypothetical protein
MKFSKLFLHPIWLLVIFCMLAYYPFFLQGKVPFPGDVVVGAYYPWLDYKWGYPAGVPVKNSLLSDSFSQFLPWKYMGVELMKQGQWPLWNNYAYSGYPLLANYASSPFQPFNLLLLLPKYWGWGLYVFAQSLVAALGMFYYLSRYIKNPWAQVAGSFVFAFSSLMTTWAEFGTGVYAASMLPWILGFIDQYLKNGKFRYLFLVSLAGLVLMLSGHAQLLTFSTILVGVYLFFNRGARAFFDKQIWLIGLAWLGALFGAMFQLLPVYVNTENSIRSAEAFSRSINFGLNNWYEMIRLIAADFFGHPATNNYWSQVFYAEQSSFLGTLTLPFILPLLLKRFRTTWVSFWGGVLGVVLILAIDSPFTQWIYSQPLPFLTYSNASRIFFLMSLAAGVLVARGIDLLDQTDFRYWFRRSLVGVLAIFIGVVVGIGIIFWLLQTQAGVSDIDVVLANLKVTLKNLVLPVGMILGGLLVMVGFGLIKSNKRWILFTFITLLMVFDLSRYFLKLNPFVSQQLVFPNTPVIDFLQTQEGNYRVSRADKEAFPPNTWMPYKLQFVEGYDPLVSEDYVRYFKVLDKQGYNSGIDRFSELNNYPSPFLDAMNVRYFVAVKRSETAEIGKGEILNYRLKETDYKKVFEDKATVVMENPQALDRVYFVSTVIELPDKQSVVAKLQQPDFDPRKIALIESSNPKESSVSAGKVEIRSYQPNKIKMSVQSSGKGFLVLSDSYDKGWNMMIDGQSKPVIQVNGAVRGFWVDEGTHQIEMYYWPAEFALGLKISVIALIVFGGCLLFCIWKKLF